MLLCFGARLLDSDSVDFLFFVGGPFDLIPRRDSGIPCAKASSMSAADKLEGVVKLSGAISSAYSQHRGAPTVKLEPSSTFYSIDI